MQISHAGATGSNPRQGATTSPPRVWLWLVLLPLLLVAAIGVAWAWDIAAWRERPLNYWAQASGLALLLWSLLSFVRGLVHLGQQRAADGWDQAREEDSLRKTRRGRRSQQVLGVSVHTGLREAGQSPAAQLHAFLSGAQALQSQAPRQGGDPVRHSYLPYDPHEPPEQVLLQVLNRYSPIWRKRWSIWLTIRRWHCYWRSIVVCRSLCCDGYGATRGVNPVSVSQRRRSTVAAWQRWTIGLISALRIGGC